MNGKGKKSKHRKKLSDDLPDMKDIKKPLFKDDDVDNNNRSDSENRKNIRSSRRRKHTKIYRKSQDKKTNDILKEIKKLLDFEKIKYINDKRYEMLYDYIQNYNRNHKYWVDNNMIEEEKEDFDENNNAYNGYINEIYEIKSKIKDDDFLQIQEPLMIQDEFYNNNIKIQKKIAKNKNLKK